MTNVNLKYKDENLSIHVLYESKYFDIIKSIEIDSPLYTILYNYDDHLFELVSLNDFEIAIHFIYRINSISGLVFDLNTLARGSSNYKKLMLYVRALLIKYSIKDYKLGE